MRHSIIGTADCSVLVKHVVAWFTCDDDECDDVHIELTSGKDITMGMSAHDFDMLIRDFL